MWIQTLTLLVDQGLWTQVSILHLSCAKAASRSLYLSISYLAISLTLRSGSNLLFLGQYPSADVLFSPFYLDFSPSCLHLSTALISSISLFSTLLGKTVNIFSFYLNPHSLNSLIHALSLLPLLFIHFTTLSIYFS